MSEIENPSAFPTADMSYTNAQFGILTGGMTLRDWFAGQAFAACFTAMTGVGGLTREERDDQYAELAREMYLASDAMLAARTNKGSAQ